MVFKVEGCPDKSTELDVFLQKNEKRETVQSSK